MFLVDKLVFALFSFVWSKITIVGHPVRVEFYMVFIVFEAYKPMHNVMIIIVGIWVQNLDQAVCFSFRANGFLENWPWFWFRLDMIKSVFTKFS